MVQIRLKYSYNKRPPSLIKAVRTRNTRMIKHFLENKTSVTATDGGGNTAIHWLCYSESLKDTWPERAEMLKLAIEYLPCDLIDVRNLEGNTPLIVAVSCGLKECIGILAAKGAALDETGQEDVLPLTVAVTSKDVDLIEHMFRNGADPNSRNRFSWTDQYYTKVPDPKYLSGLQLLWTYNAGSEILCASLCSSTAECVGFAFFLTCELLSGTSMGKNPFIYTDGITVYLKRKVLISLLGFRVSPGVGEDAYQLYDSTDVSPLVDVKAAVDLSTPVSATYKTPILENWDLFNIEQVEVSFITEALESLKIVFNATTAKNKFDWFQISNMISSPWEDLIAGSETSAFSIEGLTDRKRRFYMNQRLGGCGNDGGWFMVLYNPNYCDWSSGHTQYPVILYSKLKTSITYQSQKSDMGFGREFWITLKCTQSENLKVSERITSITEEFILQSGK